MQELADGGLPHHSVECVGSIPAPAPTVISSIMEQETIESKVASAILEKPVGEIEIEGEVYKIAPPSIATIILVSEIISKLPVVNKVSNEEIVNSVLYHARFFRPLGNIAAILILGAKGLTEKRKKKIVKSYLFGLIKREKEIEIFVDKEKILAKQILENMRPSVLFNLVIRRLQDMEIGNFFGIITSLSDANILKATKEVSI